MASKKHLDLIKQGVEAWNEWREEHYDTPPDLTGADLVEVKLNKANLSKANLSKAYLNGANLAGANFFRANLSRASLPGALLSGAYFIDANLSGANLSKAYLRGAQLTSANLSEADLEGANLFEADLRYADLHKVNLSNANLNEASLDGANLAGADLGGANLTVARLVRTNLENANLTGCRIYGISAWNLIVNEETKQSDLIITQANEPVVTVDNLEVAQFIYLLLTNQKIRHVIDTVTSKAVLLLGRFSEERKSVLNLIRDSLRDRGYVPMLFDFTPSAARDLTETIQLLANMAKFVIADLTDPKSIPQELSHIISNLPSVPVQPIILASQREYAMFEHWWKYPWVSSLVQVCW